MVYTHTHTHNVSIRVNIRIYTSKVMSQARHKHNWTMFYISYWFPSLWHKDRVVKYEAVVFCG